MNGIVTIARPDLETALSQANPPIVFEALDLRYYEAGHIPGAVALPLARVAEIAEARVPDKSRAVVVYCSSSTCRNSTIAALELASMGYTNVRVYEGGKADWRDAGLPLETGSERAKEVA